MLLAFSTLHTLLSNERQFRFVDDAIESMERWVDEKGMPRSDRRYKWTVMCEGVEKQNANTRRGKTVGSFYYRKELEIE